jgi:mannose-6-phosphate isomerase-like protein (cupin superfamily)
VTHQTLTDEQRDLAAMYALDGLNDADRRAFERHLGEGCAVCRREVDSLREVAGDLALLAPATAAPARVRTRLLEAAAREPAGGMAVIRASEGHWTELAPGFHRKDLTLSPKGKVFLIRMDPGTRAPVHSHAHVEHCYVVEGTAMIAGERLGAGDHHIAGKGTIHQELWTEQGCLLLLTEAQA